MRLLSAPRRCLHIALDAATGGVLFLLPRPPLLTRPPAAAQPSSSRHNRLSPPSNRKADVHLLWKQAWLYQYLVRAIV